MVFGLILAIFGQNLKKLDNNITLTKEEVHLRTLSAWTFLMGQFELSKRFHDSFHHKNFIGVITGVVFIVYLRFISLRFATMPLRVGAFLHLPRKCPRQLHTSHSLPKAGQVPPKLAKTCFVSHIHHCLGWVAWTGCSG